MTNSSRQICCGDITLVYELRRTQRKTLGVTVYPDQRVCIAVPLKLSQAKVDAFVLRQAPWIMDKLHRFALLPRPAPRQYVSGEEHLYLGQSYCLKVVQESPQGVVLDGDCIWVRVRDTKDPERVRRVLEAWYRVRATEVYAERLSACWPRVEPLGVPWPTVKIRSDAPPLGQCPPPGQDIAQPQAGAGPASLHRLRDPTRVVPLCGTQP